MNKRFQSSIMVLFLTIMSAFSQSYEKIGDTEMAAFWTQFKAFCKTKDLAQIERFIAPNVSYSADFSTHVYSRDEIKADCSSRLNKIPVIPKWTSQMEELSFSKGYTSKTEKEGENRFWEFKRYLNSSYEFVYVEGVQGEFSYETKYFFGKIDKIIYLYKVTYSED